LELVPRALEEFPAARASAAAMAGREPARPALLAPALVDPVQPALVDLALAGPAAEVLVGPKTVWITLVDNDIQAGYTKWPACLFT